MFKFCVFTLFIAFLVALFIHPVAVSLVFAGAWWVHSR